MVTSIDEERREEQRWVPRPRYVGSKLFDQLIENEFISAEEQGARQDVALSRMVRFATQETPHYEQAFGRLGLDAAEVRGVDDLPRLPILTRWELIERADSLVARRLPVGERVVGVSRSSGSTTGRPTCVHVTRRSNVMFSLLRHRSNRWRRLDPSATLAEIRSPYLLPRRADGMEQPPDAVIQMPTWRYDGQFFQTGPQVAISVGQPIERLIELLAKHRADYLLTYPSTLEEMAFTSPDRSPCERLRALLSVAGLLTPPMQQKIEQSFRVPIHKSYGLNEVGYVATMCEAGRYHVHAEHCIVEIVDEDGRPCPPGRQGRVLVTALRNPAMPLIRYDTDDVAQPAEGPCPCGRTLPSFTALLGRYWRYAVLPPGSAERCESLTYALWTSPPQLVRGLRRFQVHQHRDHRFELRLVSTGPMPPEFHAMIETAWAKATQDHPAPLTIVRVDDIPASPSGKRDDFTSDFYDDALAARAGAPNKTV